MGDLPVDAGRLVDELRSRRQASVAPGTWAPSASFDATLADLSRTPVQLSEHLRFLHEHADMRAVLAPPAIRGRFGFARRLLHRAVMAVLRPYFDRMQEFGDENLRALDAIARRVDEDTNAQLRLLEAVRSDLVDFARHVDDQVHG